MSTGGVERSTSRTNPGRGMNYLISLLIHDLFFSRPHVEGDLSPPPAGRRRRRARWLRRHVRAGKSLKAVAPAELPRPARMLGRNCGARPWQVRGRRCTSRPGDTSRCHRGVRSMWAGAGIPASTRAPPGAVTARASAIEAALPTQSITSGAPPESWPDVRAPRSQWRACTARRSSPGSATEVAPRRAASSRWWGYLATAMTRVTSSRKRRQGGDRRTARACRRR